ncbi:MAG: putative DNA-binding domain-containing protein [Methylophilaceae bacterium]
MLDFQAYQQTFSAHIRDPETNKKPDKVDEKRMAVYREGVFNNIFESVSVCFPVCQTILDERAWHQLIKHFVANHQATSPIFREIPQEFLASLETAADIPAYIPQLAHYEWVELAVGSMIDDTKYALSSKVDLLNEKPILTTASMQLAYDYPVHQISAQHIPEQPEKTHLLVFRNQDFEVKFVELNPMTYLLLSMLQTQELTGKQALTQLAKNIEHPNVEAVIAFGLSILQDLADQHAIIGSVK